MTKLDEADPIWGSVPADVFSWDYGGRRVRADRTGGAFAIPAPLMGRVQGLEALEKARLTSWILDRNRFGDEEWPLVTKDVIDGAASARPLTTGERMNRLLEYLSDQGFRLGMRPLWLGPHVSTFESRAHISRACAWTECALEHEPHELAVLLEEQGFLEGTDSRVRITGKGFERMEELRHGVTSSDQAFVAMWFNEETADAYSGIAEAIIAAGYRPMRIDKKEHANKIDDEIVSEIRRSKFVVADFTSGEVETEAGPAHIPRGGVYYEAGFAQGLGLPVVWTVRSDQVERIHFDTRQYNHLTWSTPAELRTKLFNRIGAILGHRADAPGLPRENVG